MLQKVRGGKFLIILSQISAYLLGSASRTTTIVTITHIIFTRGIVSNSKFILKILYCRSTGLFMSYYRSFSRETGNILGEYFKNILYFMESVTNLSTVLVPFLDRLTQQQSVLLLSLSV